MSRTRQMSVIGVMVLAMLVIAVLSGCEEASMDRAKTQPDGHQDATQVIVWRNADQVPNVVTFCADGLAWASTLSSNGYKDPSLTRLPERDSRCAQ